MSVLSDIFAGGAEGIFTGIRSLIGAFKADPTIQAQLATEVAKAELSLKAKILEAEATILQAVNATMQAEAKSDHWLQWAWRPLVGISFTATVVNNFILMPYLQKYLQPIAIPAEVWYAWLAILGVTAGFRGMEKWQRARTNGNGGK